MTPGKLYIVAERDERAANEAMAASIGDDFPEPHMDGARSESVGAEYEPESRPIPIFGWLAVSVVICIAAAALVTFFWSSGLHASATSSTFTSLRQA